MLRKIVFMAALVTGCGPGSRPEPGPDAADVRPLCQRFVPGSEPCCPEACELGTLRGTSCEPPSGQCWELGCQLDTGEWLYYDYCPLPDAGAADVLPECHDPKSRMTQSPCRYGRP